MKNLSNETEIKEIVLTMQREETITIPAKNIQDISIKDINSTIQIKHGSNGSDRRFIYEIPSANAFTMVLSSLVGIISDNYIDTNQLLLKNFKTTESYIQDRLFGKDNSSKQFFGHGLDIIGVDLKYTNGDETSVMIHWDDPKDVYTHSRQKASIENGWFYLSQKSTK